MHMNMNSNGFFNFYFSIIYCRINKFEIHNFNGFIYNKQVDFMFGCGCVNDGCCTDKQTQSKSAYGYDARKIYGRSVNVQFNHPPTTPILCVYI